MDSDCTGILAGLNDAHIVIFVAAKKKNIARVSVIMLAFPYGKRSVSGEDDCDFVFCVRVVTVRSLAWCDLIVE